MSSPKKTPTYLSLLDKRQKRVESLEILISRLICPPGKTDAAFNLRFTKASKAREGDKLREALGECGPILDIALRSMVYNLLFFNFDKESREITFGVAKKYLQKTGQSKEVMASYDKWCDSSLAINQEKMIRDTRSSIIASWLYVLDNKPQTILLQSLVPFKLNTIHVHKSVERDIVSLQGNSRQTEIGIFGMTG